MLVSFWSAKGGAGTSVVAAATALVLAREQGRSRLADCCGDLPALLGLGETPEAGLAQWLASDGAPPEDAFDRVAVDVGPGVDLLPLGVGTTTTASEGSGRALGDRLRKSREVVVADLGQAEDPARRGLLDASGASVLVVRTCYVALRRAVDRHEVEQARGVVVVEEPGRSLGHKEIADVLDRPVLGVIPVQSAIARVADAGVLLRRCPVTLTRQVERIIDGIRSQRVAAS